MYRLDNSASVAMLLRGCPSVYVDVDAVVTVADDVSWSQIEIVVGIKARM